MNLLVTGHDLHVFATTDTLNERIAGFAALVGLVLVLVTLFTSQRSSHIAELRKGTPAKRDWTTEIWLSAVVAIFTFGVFLTGLPLLVDSIRHLDLTGDSGPLRGAFILVWLLLIVLIVWQISLGCAARDERKAWVKARKLG